MSGFDVWKILEVLAAVVLVLFIRKRKIVWSGLIVGFIVGIIISGISFLIGSGFNLIIVSRAAIVGVLLGFVTELLKRIPGLTR